MKSEYFKRFSIVNGLASRAPLQHFFLSSSRSFSSHFRLCMRVVSSLFISPQNLQAKGGWVAERRRPDTKNKNKKHTQSHTK